MTDKPYSISQTECSGCGACAELCPELFAWDEQNQQLIVLKDKADPETLQKARAYCPNDCIDLHDD